MALPLGSSGFCLALEVALSEPRLLAPHALPDREQHLIFPYRSSACLAAVPARKMSRNAGSQLGLHIRRSQLVAAQTRRPWCVRPPTDSSFGSDRPVREVCPFHNPNLNQTLPTLPTPSTSSMFSAQLEKMYCNKAGAHSPCHSPSTPVRQQITVNR